MVFQVKGQCQQQPLGTDIGLAHGQKAAGAKVVFEQGKGALHLDGTAQAQMDASFRGEALRGFLTFLPKGLLQAQLLRLFRVLGPAALAAAGAAGTVLTAVPGGRDELAVFYLRTRLAKAYSHKKQDGPEAVFAPFSSAGLHLSERHCRTAGWYRVRSGPPGTPLRSRLHRRPVHFPLAMISSRLSAASFDKLINGLVQLLHRCGTAVFYGIYETVFDMIL